MCTPCFNHMVWINQSQPYLFPIAVRAHLPTLKVTLVNPTESSAVLVGLSDICLNASNSKHQGPQRASKASEGFYCWKRPVRRRLQRNLKGLGYTMEHSGDIIKGRKYGTVTLPRTLCNAPKLKRKIGQGCQEAYSNVKAGISGKHLVERSKAPYKAESPSPVKARKNKMNAPKPHVKT